MRQRIIFILLFLTFFTLVRADPLIDINQDDALRIGMRIWENECNGKIEGLTTWNDGERFASLGIGHFIWSPNNHPGAENDAFPQLIKYMQRAGVAVPLWLQGSVVPPCPWHTRSEFLAAQSDYRMQELRQFLVDTIPIQADFMAHRLINAFPKLMSSVPPEERDYLFYQLVDLLHSPQGLYALMDYVNFKGEGIGCFARKGGGWGLLQVIEGMKRAPSGLPVLQAFVWSADQALTQRVQNASPCSFEQKWLPGWRKRIYSYLDT